MVRTLWDMITGVDPEPTTPQGGLLADVAQAPTQPDGLRRDGGLLVPSVADSIPDRVGPRENRFGDTFAAAVAPPLRDAWADVMNAGVIDANPDDPALWTAFKRSNDYLMDFGRAGLDVGEAALKAVASSVGEVFGDVTGRGREGEEQFTTTMMALPEAFVGGGIGRANLFDDAVDSGIDATRYLSKAARDRANQPGQVPTMYSTPPLWRGEVPDAVTERSLERSVEAAPQLEGVLPYLTAEEAATITPRSAAQVEASYRATSPTDLIGATVEGQPKIGWYKESGNSLDTVFEEDTRRFASLLAALSPQTSVEMNLKNAVNTFANWQKAGRPKDPDEILDIMGRSVLGDKGADSVLNSWKNNAIRALSAPEGTPGADFRLSGPKVDSFGFAASGDLDRYTNDAWMANLTGVPQDLFQVASGKSLPGYSAGYLGASAAGRTAAKQMSDLLGEEIMPSEVQEGSWSFAKALYEQAAEGRPKGGPTATEIYQQGLLSPERVADVPDFATLLQDPAYGAPLREIGYGPNIDAAARAAAAIGQRDLSGAAGAGTAADVARRLDALYGHRQFVSGATPFRAGAFNPQLAARGRQDVRLPYRSRSRELVPLEGGGSGRVIEPSPGYKEALGRSGSSAPSFVQLKADTDSRRAFIKDMKAAQATHGPIGRSVTVHDSPSSYKGYKLFKTEDGKAGFGISPDGELSSVVSATDNPNRGFSDAALAAGVQNGAKWLMAFDTVLPQKYARFGFKPVARLPFSEDVARSDWGDEATDAFMKKTADYNSGKPDAVFMVYDPDFTDTVANNVGGQITDDWDKAMSLVNKAVARTDKKRGGK